MRAQGLLDFPLSTIFLKKYKSVPNEPNLIPHVESQIAGCTSECRFCNQTKESLWHLVDECPDAPEDIRKAPKHDLGPNFLSLGVVEHPVGLRDVRLEPTPLPPPVMLDLNTPLAEYWSDGSLVGAESFWLQTAAFAVIDVEQNCVYKGRVNSFALSSFTAEFYAILYTFYVSSGPVRIYTGCKTFVDKFNNLLQLRAAPKGWAHSTWWRHLLKVYELRCQIVDEPLQVHWIPVHLCDNIQVDAITDELAAELGWPKKCLIRNKLADAHAKALALDLVPVSPQKFGVLRQEVFTRQACLARLNCTIGKDQPIKNVYLTKEEQAPEQGFSFRSRFPEWGWSPAESLFKWKPKNKHNVLDCCHSFSNEDDCTTLQSFLLNLKWKTGSDLSVAYVELAFVFAWQENSVAYVTDNFASLIRFLKRMFDAVCSQPGQGLIPGRHERDQSHHCGRALPRGAIFGYRPFISTRELEGFARLIIEGGGRNLMPLWLIRLFACFHVQCDSFCAVPP